MSEILYCKIIWFGGKNIHLVAHFQKPQTWALSLTMHLWAPVSGQHMRFDLLLSAVKYCTWHEETGVSNVPTSPDAPSG